MITLGSVHIKDIVVSTHEIHQMHFAFYRLVHINDIVVSTFEIYQMHIACYIRSLLLLILTVYTKHYCYITYLSRLCFFRHLSFLLNVVLLVSAEFFAVCVSIRANISLEVVGCTICHPLQLSACSCILYLDPHSLSIWL